MGSISGSMEFQEGPLSLGKLDNVQISDPTWLEELENINIENSERGHGTCDQSYNINTIIPAITTLYTNMFISLITYLRGPFTHIF